MKQILKIWLTTTILIMLIMATSAQPVINYLGTYNSQGVPNYLEAKKDTLSIDFIDQISEALPEGEPVPDFHPDYLQGGYNMVLEITQLADVWVTYVSEGAGYKNVLGYYTYPTGNPPSTEADIDSVHIIFPNVSNSGSGGGLNPGDKVNIGRFQPGTTIGFALFANGWNSGSQQSTYGQWRLYSNNNLNPSSDPTKKQQTVILYDPVAQLYVLSFEDIVRPSGDKDFNDAVFYATSNPVTAIDPGEVPQLSLIWRGGYSTDWFDPRNWIPNTVPDSTMTAKIDKNATRNPFINGIAEVGDILIEPFKPISFSEGSKLKIYKSFTSYNEPNNIEFRAGEIEFKGKAEQKIYGNAKFYDLLVNKADGTLTIYGDTEIRGTLTLQNGDFDIANNNLTFGSTNGYSGSLLPINGNVISSGTGLVSIERFIPSPTGYHYISAPAKADLNQINDNVTLISLGGNASNYPFPNLWEYDETDTSLNAEIGWKVPQNLNVDMTAGKGFALSVQSGTVLDIWQTPENINNGNITVPLNFTSSNITDTICPPEGWNFIGNPYPSPIDLSKLTIPSGMNDALYIWDPLTQQYACYVNGISILGATAIIPGFQGFFVKVIEPTNLTFTNSIRVKENLYNTQNFKKSPTNTFNLTFSGKGKTDEIAIYKSTEASFGFDNELDALKFPSINADMPSFYMPFKEGNFAINAIPYKDTTIIIPIEVDVKYAGWYKFQKAEIKGFNDYEISVIDSLEGKETRIDQKPYSFGVDTGITKNRFFLEFKFSNPQSNNPTLIGNKISTEKRLEAEIIGKNLKINSLFNTSSTVVIMDASGKQIMNFSQNGNTLQELNFNFPRGIYFLQFKNYESASVIKLIN